MKRWCRQARCASSTSTRRVPLPSPRDSAARVPIPSRQPVNALQALVEPGPVAAGKRAGFAGQHLQVVVQGADLDRRPYGPFMAGRRPRPVQDRTVVVERTVSCGVHVAGGTVVGGEPQRHWGRWSTAVEVVALVERARRPAISSRYFRSECGCDRGGRPVVMTCKSSVIWLAPARIPVQLGHGGELWDGTSGRRWRWNRPISPSTPLLVGALCRPGDRRSCRSRMSNAARRPVRLLPVRPSAPERRPVRGRHTGSGPVPSEVVERAHAPVEECLRVGRAIGDVAGQASSRRHEGTDARRER